MTGNDKKERNSLNRLADILVDDILNVSDEEILAEFHESHGDPDQHAVAMRALFERTVIAANKGRLVAARAGVAASHHSAQSGIFPVNIAEARKRLRSAGNMPNTPQQLTLAARNERELSDIDVLAMCEDLQELGLPPPNDDRGSKS